VCAHVFRDDWPEDGEDAPPPPQPESTDQTEPEQNGDEPSTDKTEDTTGGDQTESESPTKETATEEENQAKEMTLDEYKALMSKSKVSWGCGQRTV
jgi:hypothetical protein